jgi:deoxyribodipyrimidine photo-lyase
MSRRDFHTAIHWFRRDLRLLDNSALGMASEGAGRLALIYIHDPEDRPGGASAWWLERSLAALNEQLNRQGQKLLIFSGSPQDVLLRLANELQARSLTWNRVHEPRAQVLENRLTSELTRQGIQVRQGDGALLFAPGSVLAQSGQPFRVFTPFWRTCRQRLSWKAPASTPPHLPPPPDDIAWNCPPPRPQPGWTGKLASHWTPGEPAARQRLDRFANGGLNAYARLRDRPDQGGTSRLSAHLHWGEITPKQILAALDRQRSRGHLDETSFEKFLSELGWREFCHHLLAQFPELDRVEFQPAFRDHPWKNDAALLNAWQKGRTGFPIVDAGMRELWETGWMHNRVRMVAASFLVKQLQIDWRLGLAWFNDTLVDADLANNAGGWQWVAGTGADAAPYFRIFNPLLQGRKFDPEESYVRRWLGSTDLGNGYPPPMIDLKQARQQALAARKPPVIC